MDNADTVSKEPSKDRDKEDVEVLQPGIVISAVEVKSQRSKDNVKGGARPKEKQNKNRPKTTEENREKQTQKTRHIDIQKETSRKNQGSKTGQIPRSGGSYKELSHMGSEFQGERPRSGNFKRPVNSFPAINSEVPELGSSPTGHRGYSPREPRNQQRGQTYSPRDHYYGNSQNTPSGRQRNTPRGQTDSPREDNPNTPQEKTKGRGKKNTPQRQQNNNKQRITFEPYMSQEDLQRGLKLGQLIQGPLRINPKNYEEGYIPHPDGVSDIFISGMKDRNRALNGDIVAVMLLDKKDWKVNVENLQTLKERHSESEKSESLADMNSKDDNDTDSEPDVIIESEEIVELKSEGTSQDINQSAVGIQNSSQSERNQNLPSREPVVSKNSKDNTLNVDNVSEQLKSCQIGSATPNVDQTPGGKGERTGQNQGKTPGSAQKKFTSLHQVLKDGDHVVKNLFTSDNEEMSKSANRLLMRTGKVVAIIEPKHSRACTGSLHLMNDKNPNKALFKPLDHRLPRIMVPMDNCPKDFLQRPETHANTLFICRIKDWRENSMYADGELMRSLGEAGEIEPETEAILIENDVDYSEFTEEMLSSIPVQKLPWSIPEEEFAKRRDFRQDCVFTIDPATARDLDDAVSCEKLEDGTYNVGVHIADVSYFLKEETELDKRARFRATSVYLVQKVIPMLPRILCEELCSLNPNQDKLTFSVVWNMSETGEIYGEWFGRSIIRSCVKLSYDHAQGFIEEPEREWTKEELPEITGGFPINQIRDTVLHLQEIAKNLRKSRFDEGALRLDQVKIQYTLDKDTGMPNGYNVYKQRDSNRLIEEFMLLANMAVAHRLRKFFPEKAFLRRHPPPQVKMVEDLVELCNNLGFPIEAGSAGSLQRSLWRYAGSDEMSASRMQVLVSMCSKPMQNAKYFCTGCLADEELYRHYALNVPLYTHFTSPIRRYADVMVHRMLAASLDYDEITDMNNKQIQGIADNCNDRKTNAKRASELSAELYFAVFVKTAGPFEEQGMVMGVLDKAFDVFINKFGVIKRVYCDKLELKDKLYYKEQKNPVLTLYWQPPEGQTSGPVQKISIFTVVTCILKQGDLPLQWMAIIKRPKE